MLHADLQLGLRLERAAMDIEGQYANAHAALRPDLDIEVKPIADGAAIFAGIGNPMSQATGLGLSGAVTVADFEALEVFYFRRNAPVRLIVCPMANDSLVAVAKQRGYRLAEFESTVVRPLDDIPEASHAASIQVSVVGREDMKRFAHTVGPNFSGDGVLSPEMHELICVMFGTTCGRAVLATVDGEDAGGGSVLISGGVAMLAGAGTLPKFRNRGVHAALFEKRLRMAKDAGCDLAVMGAKPGSTSQRNAERKGFRLAYTKCELVREPK